MELTDAQIAKVDAKVQELAQELADSVSPSYDFTVGKDDPEPWGDAEEGAKYHSEQIYGSSAGPSAGLTLWDDVEARAAIEEGEDEDGEREAPDWVDELCADLAEAVSARLAERFPDRAAAFAEWDDNCLFAVVSEE